MTTYRKSRAVIALLTAASLVLAACGTRVDRETIDHIARGSGTQSGTGQGLPGEGSAGGLANGEAPGEAGAGETGDGSGESAGQSGSAAANGGKGTGPGAAGKPGAPGGEGGKANGAPIVIGSVGTYSGPIGSIVKQGPVALRAWAAATNANGGIKGRPIKVIVYDDGGDAARARSQVQELVETHKAVALVSSMGATHAVKAWKGYIEQKKVPAVGGTCTQPFWNESPVMFNQCPSADSMFYGAVFLPAKQSKGKKFGGLFCTESAACSEAEDAWFGKGYAKRAGLNPVYRAKVSLTQPDFTSECIQARNAGVEILAVAGDSHTATRAAASCRRQNFTPQFLLAGPVPAADSPSKPGLGNVLSPQGVFPFAGLSSPAAKAFHGTWGKYSREAPGPSAAQGWAAAKIFEKAARSAKDITRQGLITALYGFKNERFGGLTVPLSYGPKGTTDSKCAFRMEARAGKWVAPDGDKMTCW